MAQASAPRSLGHPLVRMTGRDPHEAHRTATPLELLFDLTFVATFGIAADQLAHAVALDHVAAGVAGFLFAMGATCWAWINFSWFASAYDTDDWFYRLTTLVQMIGVVVFALGLQPFFHSLEVGDHVDNAVLVAGYVVMRIAMITQWIRAAVQDPDRRPTAIAYARSVGMAQVGWIVLAVLQTSVAVFFVGAAALFAVELLGPYRAERRSGGTPWHPHHIAERYALLAIIAMGEVIFGTVAAVSVLVERQGWSVEAALVVVAGIGLAFGLWWTYFLVPSGEVLERHRRRAWVWGYGHILIYAAIAATGAGLHVVSYVVGDVAEVGPAAAIVSVAVPVLVFSVSLFSVYTYLLHEFDRLHIWLFAGTVVMLVAAVVLAFAGASLGVCLVIVTLSPAVVVVGYEVIGHRHQAAALERILE
jgi:low temperature requirement protein LtrA